MTMIFPYQRGGGVGCLATARRLKGKVGRVIESNNVPKMANIDLKYRTISALS
jgi:hypothetical protein